MSAINNGKIINSIYLTKRNEFSPIMDCHVQNSGAHIDLHIQVVNILPSEEYPLLLKAFGPKMKLLAKNSNWFEMSTPFTDGYCHGEVVVPLDLIKMILKTLIELLSPLK